MAGQGAAVLPQGPVQVSAPMVVAAPVQPVDAPVIPVEGVPSVPAPKKIKVYCWKCKSKAHAAKDCTVQHYCYVCDNSKHPTAKCPTLKLPRPTTFVSGFGDEDLMFTQFPDSVYKELPSAISVPTACVEVIGEVVSAATVEAQVARICPVAAWKWEAVPHGDTSFLLGFPPRSRVTAANPSGKVTCATPRTISDRSTQRNDWPLSAMPHAVSARSELLMFARLPKLM